MERLSAMKIAKIYGLRYKSLKVAESTVLYQLRKNGIKRRNPAEQVRKVTEQIESEWARRYQAGNSLREIAAEEFSPATVFLNLRKRGVELRDKVEAQIEAVTRHERKPFQGDSVEKTYLMGLRYGDLDAVRHGRAIRVRVSATLSAMADLFESSFSPYGFVHRYSREAQLTGHEWTLECDLDGSFEFLLKKINPQLLLRWDEELFYAFLSGLLDAEGSAVLHKKGKRHDPELMLPNADGLLIRMLSKRLEILGFHAHVSRRRAEYLISGRRGVSELWRWTIWRFEEAKQLLLRLRLRHRGKIAKSELALALKFGSSDQSQPDVFASWTALKASIEQERTSFLKADRNALEMKEFRTLTLISPKRACFHL